MIVKVTAEHIRKGKQRRCGYCPIALALKDISGDRNEWAGYSDMSLNGKTYPTPDRVFAWMMAFDQGNDVQPIEFNLKVKKQRQ